LDRLNKGAAPDGILCVGRGKTVYVGRLDFVDWHRHGASVFIAGLAGNFRLGTHAGKWLSCRAAVVPAGVRHALDLGGDPLAVFYPEPNVATLSDLTRFGATWDAAGQILVGQTAEVSPFRELYEDRAALSSPARCSMTWWILCEKARGRLCWTRASRALSNGSAGIPQT
jgi:hypothetical protein